MKQYDVIIIGAGAAGLFAAATASGRGLRTLLLERNSSPAKKLLITGKGRCNLTNNCTIAEFMSNVPVNPRFLYSSLSAFSPSDTMEYFEALGVPLKTERGRRVFPQSDRAADISAALVKAVRDSGAELICRRAQKLILEDKCCKGVVCGDEKYYGRVIIATGGSSYPQTGSTGDGYTLAAQAGHTIIPPTPSLVPVVTAEDCSPLMGLTLKNVTLSVRNNENGKIVFSELGEMLFTHFGLSGPLVLSASAHMRDAKSGKYALLIDLKPGLSSEQLDKRIQRDFSERQNRALANILPALLPRALVLPVLRAAEMSPEQQPNSVTRVQRLRLGEVIKSFSLSFERFRPIEEAIITSGGVSVKEINPASMESKLAEGLHFAGEVIDVDAYTGGYNLQIAFSTGYAAGMSV